MVSYNNTRKGKCRVTFKVKNADVCDLMAKSITVVGDFPECSWNPEKGFPMSVLKDGSFSTTVTIEDVSRNYTFKYLIESLDSSGNIYVRWENDRDRDVDRVTDGSGNENSLVKFV